MFRKMRRFNQQLPEEKCLEILKNEPRGVLAVLGDEGYPYAVPVNFLYRNGKIFIHGAKEGHTIDSVRGYEKASFCVIDKGEKQEGDWALWFNSVICFGRIRVMEDQDEVIAMSRELCTRFPATQEEIEGMVKRSGPRTAGLELIIEHMTGKRVHEK